MEPCVTPRVSKQLLESIKPLLESIFSLQTSARTTLFKEIIKNKKT